MIEFLSPSALAMWETCARQFFYRRLMRLPGISGDMTALAVGIGAHDALDRLYRLPATERTTGATQREADVATLAVLTDPKYVPAVEQLGESQLATQVQVATFGVWKLEDPRTSPAMLTEREIRATVAGVPVLMRVDRLDRRNRRIVPVDYKTGAKVSKFTVESLAGQLTVNALAIEEIGLEDNVDCGVGLFTVAGREVPVQISSQRKAGMRGRLQRAWEEIGEMFETGEAPKANARWPFPCKWCVYLADCPEGRMMHDISQ